ncbi:MAG: MFS transporter, partial [Rhizobacter sp.]
LALVLQFQNYAVLLVLMLLLGAGSALFDVAMNSDGNTLETQSRRKVMSGLHGMFSLGGMTGALVCAGMHRLAVPVGVQLVAVALVLAPVMLWAALRVTSHRLQADAVPPAFARPRGLLLWMGVLTTLGMVAEGAMYDWSALFVRQELHTDEATGALAFAAFSAAMAGGRFVGDWVRGHFAPVALLRRSGALAALGMALALTAGAPWAALLGFMLVGLGLSNVVPVVFAAAGQVPGIPAAQGVAAVSAVGYMGFMIGPPLIGVLAKATTLSAALWTVALFAVLMALAARSVLGRRG